MTLIQHSKNSKQQNVSRKGKSQKEISKLPKGQNDDDAEIDVHNLNGVKQKGNNDFGKKFKKL